MHVRQNSESSQNPTLRTRLQRQGRIDLEPNPTRIGCASKGAKTRKKEANGGVAAYGSIFHMNILLSLGKRG